MDTNLEKLLEETAPHEELAKDRLIIMNGPEDGRIFPLDRDLTTIGRLDGMEIALFFDLTVSRTHARILREGASYFIEDMKSRFGTQVDGIRIQGKHPLCDGNMIQVGETLLGLRCRAAGN